jgi:NAD(P)-dependent dehydrogenase (short-subunit alcohol dehydrogenase family)
MAKESRLDGMVAGKTALVTGGGSGIGEATATLLAIEGARVAVVDRDGDAATRVAAAIQELGGTSIALEVDVADQTAVAAMVDAVVTEFGRLDIAHNNAGISGTPTSFIDLAADEWHRMISVNLTSVFFCMQAELRVMVEQRSGSIVNTSSVAGVSAVPSLPHYGAAKHGVLGLTKSAAREYAKQGIRINAVLPGFVRTPMTEAIIASSPEMEKMMNRTVGRGVAGAPSEIAEAVVWLSSDRASLVCGESVIVDGGTACR